MHSSIQGHNGIDFRVLFIQIFFVTTPKGFKLRENTEPKKIHLILLSLSDRKQNPIAMGHLSFPEKLKRSQCFNQRTLLSTVQAYSPEK